MIRKKLLYIGNKVNSKNTVTSVDTLSFLFQTEGFEVYVTSSQQSKVLRLLEMVYSFFRYKNKVDFILIDVYSTQNFWYAFIISQLCRLYDKKYVAKLHGGELPNRFRKSHKLCEMIFNHAYLNTAPSNYLVESFKKYNFKNIVLVPNTIEIENYEYTKRELDFPKLLWVRSFSKIYNPNMALRVLYKIRKLYPNAILCMIGPEKDGSLELTKETSNNMDLGVEFTGKLSKKEWAEKAKDFNIFINTTHFDNTPVSVMEAMALGLPVISTNVGGIPYLIDDGSDGLLINDDDAYEMVQKIDFLIKNPLKSLEITNNARRKVEQFDWQVVKHKWFEILQ